MDTKALQAEIDRLQGQLIDVKVDLNIEQQRTEQLERDLAEARAQVKAYELGTQTMRKLRILGESDDDNGYDPRETGQFRAWKGVVR